MPSAPVFETLAQLIGINSVNPAFANGVSERGFADWIHRFLAARGLEFWEQEVLPGRPNVIARIPGRDPTRRVVLEAHMDTASITGMTIPPFEPRIEGGRMYGRGACDTKGGLAAMIQAVASVAEEKTMPPCEVWMAAVADEEHLLRGAQRLAQGLKADAAIVAEPTSLRAVIATKGVLRWRIVVRGRAAHSSKPHLGINAIDHMARIILAFEKDGKNLSTRQHPLLGTAAYNIGVIHGGVQVNFVPDTCTIEVDRRLLPGESVPKVLDHYRSVIGEVRREHPTLDAVMEPPMIADEALDTPASAPAAQTASAVLGAMGLDPALCGVPYGSDGGTISRAGIPTLVFGPGSIDQAHAAVEYIELDEVEQAREFYRNFILRFQ